MPKKSAAHKAAWMDGARAGTEIAFELIIRSIENLRKTMGIKARKDLPRAKRTKKA